MRVDADRSQSIDLKGHHKERVALYVYTLLAIVVRLSLFFLFVK